MLRLNQINETNRRLYYNRYRENPSPGNNVLSKSRILSVGIVEIVIYKQIQLERRCRDI